MPRSLGDLIRDADELITSKLASPKPQVQEDDIFKMAKELVKNDEVPVTDNDYSMAEKIAHSIALVETLINMPALIKVAEFEKKAKESGFTSEQISDYFEKKASINFVSIAQALPWFNRG